MAVLIAQHALDHQHPYSHFVLSHLIFSDGAAERICISRPFLVGAWMASLGGFIRFKSYQAMGSMFTFDMSIRNNHKLVTSGPYAIVRHPGYTGVMLVVIGILLVHLSKVSIPLVEILAAETASVPLRALGYERVVYSRLWKWRQSWELPPH